MASRGLPFFLIFLLAGFSGNAPVPKNSLKAMPLRLENPCNDSTYQDLLKRIATRKSAFKKAYLRKPGDKKLLDSCRRYLQQCMADSLFAYWENTPWNFYGTTEKPQCGEIACGYFVTTLLRDLGFQIPRVRWAEVASETFIREFCNNKVYHYIGWSCEDVIGAVKLKKGSYFLVGLDTHVGIIEKRDTGVNLIHSADFFEAKGVTREAANGWNPFASSHYRVFGELFTDVQLVNWITNKKYS